MADSFRKIKTLTSYAAHARFLAQTEDAPAGVIGSSFLPASEPYRYSRTKEVLVDYDGRNVVVLEVAHKRYEVWEVPAGLVRPATEED